VITEKDLQEAIAECEGTRNPNASTCLKLAAFYTIRNEMFPAEKEIPRTFSHSYFSPQEPEYESETEIAGIIKDMSKNAVMGLFDELMTALQVLHPRLYEATVRKAIDKRG